MANPLISLNFASVENYRVMPDIFVLKAKIMKIALILVICLSTFNINNQAQYNDEYNLFVGGLTAGGSLSQVDGDSYRGYDKMGLIAGGIVYIPFGDDMNMPIEGTIALSMEVLYSQKGAKGGINQHYGVKSHSINLHYGEVPILLNFYRGSRKSIYGLGLSIGYLGFNEEIIDKGYGGTRVNDPPFNKFDLGLVGSFNIHLFKGFFLNPRFSYSMIRIRNNAGGLGRTDQFNNVISLRLMYLFKRG